MPGIVPRVRGLVGSGFGSFALFIALVFRAVRLLPDGHPYLNPMNIGKFSVVSVIFEAARHIKFNRYQLRQNNIDQILVFAMILAAIALMLMQFITLLMALFVPSAMAFSFGAGGPSFTTPLAMFDTPVLPGGVTITGGATQSFYDIAFIFLDRVFGVPGIFNSCISDGVADSCVSLGAGYASDQGMAVNDPGTFPWPYHRALQGIFQFYSIGMLVIAMFLLIYFTIVVVIETAQTGTPFGKRFNTIWAPLRLVTAAGLLIPVSFGLNAGQFIVLYSAKWGSNFASNGWIGFNSMITGTDDSAAGLTNDLVAQPQIPDPTALLHFISIMQACRTIENTSLIPHTRGMDNKFGDVPDAELVKPYIVKSSSATGPVFEELTNGSMTYENAVNWSDKGDVVIRFGVQDANKFKDEKGTVRAWCGEITLPTVVAPYQSADAGTYNMAYVHEGAAIIMEYYWRLLNSLIFVNADGAQYMPESITDYPAAPAWNNLNQLVAKPFVEEYTMGNFGPAAPAVEPTPAQRAEMINYFNEALRAIVAWGVQQERDNTTNPYQMKDDLLVRGWAAAGVWYNRIAEINGTMTVASWNLPKVSQYPITMKTVAETKLATQHATPPSQTFDPMIQDQSVVISWSQGGGEPAAAGTYWQITKWWQDGGTGFSTSTRTQQTGNVILDMINWLFGTSGLFSIRQNANVHPLAQLSSIGKSLVERSVGLLGVGLGASILQPWMDNLPAQKSLQVISGFAFSILSIGASAGFILYYIIPFLPFIYFFFAVAGWVKAIFEAMVGVPLWALAHIRIDGSGLPGDAASGGYFLILEIMLRPILIIFGLVASVTIYAASVQVLNDVFNLAVANVTGIDMDKTMATSAFTMENLRGSIDTFFYTILYVMLVYMLGMSSFKLIDLIPSSMMRWMGASVSPFTDSGEGAASQLVSYGSMGSQMAFSQIGGAVNSAASGTSSALKSAVDGMRRNVQ